MRWIVGGKAEQDHAASPSQMGRFETQWLAAPANLSALSDLSGQWIDIVHGHRAPKGIVLDMDSSVSPTHGEQEMSVWNGHYQCTCYHPLFVFNQFGDLERGVRRVAPLPPSGNPKLRNAHADLPRQAGCAHLCHAAEQHAAGHLEPDYAFRFTIIKIGQPNEVYE
jgi:Transposase DDE domain group 1